MLVQIAEYLKEDLLRIYTHIRLENYQVTQEDIALRAMRNLCLSYLAYTNLGNTVVQKHYNNANNMTDTLAALNMATKAALPCRDALLADFEQKWQHDGLVMDKWFALQATRPDENVLEIVQVLMDHPSFNFNNPNQSNPQVAARLIEPLIRFSRFDAQRQTLMKRALERLSAVEDLSKDLFEKIEKALQ